jgi:hypothetical protein
MDRMIDKQEKLMRRIERNFADYSLLHNGFTGNCRVEFPEVAK